MIVTLSANGADGSEAVRLQPHSVDMVVRLRQVYVLAATSSSMKCHGFGMTDVIACRVSSHDHMGPQVCGVTGGIIQLVFGKAGG